MDSAVMSIQDMYTPSKTPSKTRSFSDSAANTPTQLQPSPTFLERVSQQSKDDHALPSENAYGNPTTPKASRRNGMLSRGLSLQMPGRIDMPSPSHFPRPAPLSPQLDQHNIYMQQPPSVSASPATSLPRHSRGLDFARACSTLHHSTLAESSPDSSPVITQKGMMIPIPMRKGSMSSMMLDSPNIMGPGSVPWGAERSAISSSVGSVNMLASESSSAESDEDASMAGDDTEEPIYTTPQVHKLQNPNSAMTPFDAPSTPGAAPGIALWGNGIFSPAPNSLMKTIRRARLHKNTKRSRKSSSSASGSGYSSLNSPRTTSPPPMRSIESAAGGGYFPWTATATAARSRRESLALGTDKLHLSSGNDSGDEASHPGTPSTPNVVRRPVTRRHNLLPKTKGMARIRAQLAEEAAPVETESRREAETICQVRERDGSNVDLDLTSDRPQTGTAHSSPSLLPAVLESAQEDFGRELDSSDPSSSGTKRAHGLGVNFAAHANRNSAGIDYWNRFDPSNMRTPPPNFHRNSSSVMSDINLDSDSNTPTTSRRARARSNASDASEAFVPNSSAGINTTSSVNDDMHLKKFKRRREDDFDIATIKRRAVSPGMSAQNSPVLTQSPSTKDWGGPPERKGGESSSSQSQSQPQSQPSQQPPSRHGSGGSSVSIASGSTPSGKKLGLQGMVDTNDGLMKMSIE